MPGRTYPDPNSLNGLNGVHSDQEELEELGSDEFPGHFLERNGRLFPSPLSLTPYPLPVDTPEQEVPH